MASAGSRIEVTVEDAEVRAKLARLIAKVRHPAMAKIGEVLSARTRKRFETESGPDGWPCGCPTAR